MGLLGALTKAGLAKKALAAARKPKNQQKVKELWAKFRRQQGKKRR